MGGSQYKNKEPVKLIRVGSAAARSFFGNEFDVQPDRTGIDVPGYVLTCRRLQVEAFQAFCFRPNIIDNILQVQA